MKPVRLPSWIRILPLLAALLAAVSYYEPILRRAELASVDWRFIQRGPRETSANIVLVAIDNDTELAWRKEPSVFWGTSFAQVLDRCVEGGAKRVVVDFFFPRDFDPYLRALTPNAPSPTFDLLQALAEHKGKIYMPRRYEALPFDGDTTIPEFYADAVAPYLGFVELPTSPDGVAREMFRYQMVESEAVESLASVAVEPERKIQPYSGEPETFRINYTGRNFPTLSAIHLLNAHRPNPKLKDAIVVICATYDGSSDIHDTPFGARQSGGSVLADGIATLWDKRPIRTLPMLVEVMLVVLAAGAAGAMTLLGRTSTAASCLIGFAIVYGTVCVVLFRMDWQLPLVSVGWALILGGFFGSAGQAVWRVAERDSIEKIMGVMVSEGVTREVLKRGGVPVGQRVDAAVMFLDVRRFTTWSESRDPEAVVAAINQLHSVLLPVVERHGGYVNTFLGDGFLAVFGPPSSLANPCEAAFRAAEELVQASRTAIPELPSDASDWLVGIGLHFGPVLVGGVGAGNRFQFTVMGNTVNTAQRLEGQCKELKCAIVASSDVVSRLEKPRPVEGPIDLELRGLSRLVASYSYLPIEEPL